MITNGVWWKSGVIYQIYPRSFCDTTGDGVGDLQGIISKLPYLKNTLGIDAIWISPFYSSPMKDFGYDVSDYRDIDPLFGNKEDFQELLDTSHQLDLKLIIDLVPNHSSDQHPWFLESRSSVANPKRDWYVWKDSRQDGSEPNNWLSLFGGKAWEWDQKTGQYYLHSFLKEQPDLNWRNPQVQHAIFDVVRYWLELGVDGFRIDVAHFIMKDPQFRDNPPNLSEGLPNQQSNAGYNSQIHLFDKGHPDTHQVYRDFRAVLDAYSQDQDRMSMGEIHISDWEKWVTYYGEKLDELHFPINFSLLGVPWEAETIRNQVEELEKHLPAGGWPNYVLANHDETRILSRVGKDQACNAALLLLTLRGTPCLYYGDEIGMSDVEIPPDLCLDPSGIRQPGQGRDAYRTPMQWSADAWAGFSPAHTKSTWLPLSGEYRQVNVETQILNPGSLLVFYIKLLALRKSHPALQTGQYQSVPDCPPGVYLYRRENHQEKFLVLINFTPQAQRIDPALIAEGVILLSTNPGREPSLADFQLHPNEGVLIQI